MSEPPWPLSNIDWWNLRTASAADAERALVDYLAMRARAVAWLSESTGSPCDGSPTSLEPLSASMLPLITGRLSRNDERIGVPEAIRRSVPAYRLSPESELLAECGGLYFGEMLVRTFDARWAPNDAELSNVDRNGPAVVGSRVRCVPRVIVKSISLRVLSNARPPMGLHDMWQTWTCLFRLP